MYLTEEEVARLTELLQTFFSLPYSTDLSGKDAETLLRIVKGENGRRSRRKELFDIVVGPVGYSVKTLRKRETAARVDIQEQRFCDVEEVRRLRQLAERDPGREGELLLRYMRDRVRGEMERMQLTAAKSLILLKDWNAGRTDFAFRYWEEDLLGYVETLSRRHEAGEIEWVAQGAGIHGRDRLRQDGERNVRLIRMHYKHNQIFTDHDIPEDAVVLRFGVQPMSWAQLSEIVRRGRGDA
jgi:hypothetical protein